jgi:hypothetical protein
MDLYPADEVGRLQEFIARRRTEGRAQYEFYIPQSDGGRLPVEVTSRLVHGADGRAYGIITATDISDQRRIQAELSRTNALLLERQQQMEQELQLAERRPAVVLRGRKLEYFTIVWNTLEGVIALVSGIVAGSISLVGFGIDSFIEVTSGSVLLWRMSVDSDVHRRETNEKRALRIIGACFLLLAAYVTYDSISDLWSKRAPENSIAGIILACASLIVMPILSRAKRMVGRALSSAAMHADAKQTEFCTYLSGILLVGLLLNALFGLWWADPAAALIMVPIIAKEGIDGVRGKPCDECPPQ